MTGLFAFWPRAFFPRANKPNEKIRKIRILGVYFRPSRTLFPASAPPRTDRIGNRSDLF